MMFLVPEAAPGSPKTASFSSFSHTPPSPSKLRSWRWWLMISLFTFFILAGQSAATLLGRFYYNNGGQSLWMATIVQSAGAPLLFPFLLLLHPLPSSPPTTNSAAKIAAVYISLGLLIAGDNLMYSYGLLYLPVSTYSLVCATQLAFNALFAYFLNSQKFTPFIFNSIILLTLAAALLGVRSEGASAAASSGKYALGFVLTIAASATFSLVMSLTQLSFQKVFKSEAFAVAIHMILWTNFLAAAASVAGLFVSGEWRGIHSEFVGFQKGRVSYVMALLWTAISWLLYSVGAVGLIFVVSSLFSNVIATLALPLVPVFAVVFFHDRMDGIKVVALLIAVLGFVNYLYQHYLDDAKEKKSRRRRGDDL